MSELRWGTVRPSVLSLSGGVHCGEEGHPQTLGHTHQEPGLLELELRNDGGLPPGEILHSLTGSEEDAPSSWSLPP